MLHCIRGHIEPPWRSTLRAAGLADLARLACGDVGEPFKHKADSSVHRIEPAADARLYLKRYAPLPARRVLRRFARGKRPWSPALHEYQAIQLLRGCEFDVMEPVAHGERRAGGLWPRESFLLSKEVPGPTFQQMWRDSANDTSPERRRGMAHALGRHIGRLHRTGFYHPLRLRDLICRDGRLDQLAMIDLDTKGWLPRLLPFDWTHSADSLAHSTYLFLRTGKAQWGRHELRPFLAGYTDVLGRPPAGFIKHWLERIDTKLRDHADDVRLTALLPDAPRSLAVARLQAVRSAPAAPSARTDPRSTPV